MSQAARGSGGILTSRISGTAAVGSSSWTFGADRGCGFADVFAIEAEFMEAANSASRSVGEPATGPIGLVECIKPAKGLSSWMLCRSYFGG